MDQAKVQAKLQTHGHSSHASSGMRGANGNGVAIKLPGWRVRDYEYV